MVSTGTGSILPDRVGAIEPYVYGLAKNLVKLIALIYLELEMVRNMKEICIFIPFNTVTSFLARLKSLLVQDLQITFLLTPTC